MDLETGPVINGINGGSSYYIAALSAPTAATWHFYCMWRDATDGKVRLQIDNTGTIAVSSAASNPPVLSLALFFGHAPGSAIFGLNGRLSRWGWIKGDFLTTTERTTMYNGGPSGALNWADIVSGHL